MKRFGPALSVKEELKLTEPCFGLGGFHKFCQIMGWETTLVNSMDIDGQLGNFFRSLAQMGDERAMKIVNSVSFGDKNGGNMLKVKLNELLDSDLLSAGGPCQGWAGHGASAGFDDPRSYVSLLLVDWIVELANRDPCLLKAIFLENSTNITKSGSGIRYQSKNITAMELIRDGLRAKVAHFSFEHVIVNSEDDNGHVRLRCWIRGVRGDLLMDGERLKPIPQPLTIPLGSRGVY